MNTAESTIDSYLSEHLDDYIAETSELCAQPSISAISEGMEACAELVIEMLQRRRFTVTRFRNRGQSDHRRTCRRQESAHAALLQPL